jgi:hypothetical protein
MTKFFICAAILSGSLLMAQNTPLQNTQRTTPVVGITPGQTARLDVLYPTAPAPIDQVLCGANLILSDDQGKALKSSSFTGMIAGKAVSISVNADTDLGSTPRTELYGFSIQPPGCNLQTSLEIIDNVTQRTLVVVGSRETYPFPGVVSPAMQPAATANHR